MKKPVKLIVKNSITEKLKENNFDKVFLVRNIYSRFAVYIISIDDITSFKEEILERFKDSIDTIEAVDYQNDPFIVNDLEHTCKKVKNTKNIYFADRLVLRKKILLYELKTINKLIKQTKN